MECCAIAPTQHHFSEIICFWNGFQGCRKEARRIKNLAKRLKFVTSLKKFLRTPIHQRAATIEAMKKKFATKALELDVVKKRITTNEDKIKEYVNQITSVEEKIVELQQMVEADKVDLAKM